MSIEGSLAHVSLVWFKENVFWLSEVVGHGFRHLLKVGTYYLIKCRHLFRTWSFLWREMLDWWLKSQVCFDYSALLPRYLGKFLTSYMGTSLAVLYLESLFRNIVFRGKLKSNWNILTFQCIFKPNLWIWLAVPSIWQTFITWFIIFPSSGEMLVLESRVVVQIAQIFMIP